MPRPIELMGRLLAASVLVLVLTHVLERQIVGSLIPLFTRTIGILDGNFVVTDVRLNHEGLNDTVSFSANLVRPVSMAGQTLYPFGWGDVPPGYAQVDCTLGGVLLYGSVILILSLAWPVRRASEMVWRLLLCVPVLMLTLLVGIPITVIAELWNSFEQDAHVHPLNLWMVWSRFLTGGGGFMLALALSGVVISLATRFGPTPRDHSLA
jgi:hypothetical protein